MVNHDEIKETDFQKQRWALLAHAEAISALSRAQSQEELLSGVCRAITSQSPYVLAWVGEAKQDDNKTIQVLACHGSATNYLKDIFVSWSDKTPSGRGPISICIRTKTSCVIPDTDSAPQFLSWRERAQDAGIRCCVAVPIIDNFDEPLRVLAVYASKPNAFTEIEVQLFENFANEIAFGLDSLKKRQRLELEIEEKQRAQEQLIEALRTTIQAMSKTMEWRDPYTAGHQRRVANISAAIGQKLNWSQEEIQAVFLAGMVHDIGKIAVPAEILTKPTRLTELEVQMVQTHVEAGYEILRDIPFPWPIAEMVRQHHERLDGSGYPEHLTGTQIVQGARVLAVADTIEAMSTHRPYRPALGLTAAITAIREESGTRLDPAVVAAAISLMDDKNTLQGLVTS